MESGVDYSGLIPGDVLGATGLTINDVELSIQLAHLLSEAVKLRRSKIGPGPASEEAKAEDDRLFLGAITLLAQKMKPRKR